MWNFVKNSELEEQADVMSLVLELATSEGRAHLIAMHGAKFDGGAMGDGDAMSACDIPHPPEGAPR